MINMKVEYGHWMFVKMRIINVKLSVVAMTRYITYGLIILNNNVGRLLKWEKNSKNRKY